MNISAELPRHHQGVKMNTELKAQFENVIEAQSHFSKASTRLLDVNQWDFLCGLDSPRYQLTNKDGVPKHGLAVKGDLIRITLPAPSKKGGTGDDWVLIEDIERSDEGSGSLIAMHVHPTQDPQSQSGETAHFYMWETSNTFSVERIGSELIVGIYGRNEVPNTKEAEGLYNKMRNGVMAVMGWLGLSKVNWKTLAKGIMNGAKNEDNPPPVDQWV